MAHIHCLTTLNFDSPTIVKAFRYEHRVVQVNFVGCFLYAAGNVCLGVATLFTKDRSMSTSNPFRFQSIARSEG